MIVFLTGASGVGKTSIVEKLEQDYSNSRFEFYHFDKMIRIPSAEEMIEKMQSIENWQKETTKDWIDKLMTQKTKDIAILEGSTNIQSIISIFKELDYKNYLIILIDCDEKTMIDRLINKRNQPELANPDMKNWLKYLRKQAKELSIDIINTSKSDMDNSIKLLMGKIEEAYNIQKTI